MQPGPDKPPSKEEQMVWEIVLSLTDSNHDGVGLIFGATEVYFFTGSEYFFFLDPLHIFGTQSQISWEQIGSPQTEEGVSSEEEGLDDWGSNMTYGPQLYRLEGGDTAATYKESVLKEIDLRVSIVETGANGSVSIKDFPSISKFQLENSKDKVIDFFRSRGISSGNYEVCRVGDVVLDLFLQLDRLPEFLSREGVQRLTKPGEYGATVDSNRLGYSADYSKVFFQFDLTQGPDLSNAELVTGLNYLFSFLFHKMELYVKGPVPFDQFTSELTGVPMAELEELLEGEGGLDPFLEDLEYGIEPLAWVTPDIVQVNLIRPLNDPSFGRPTKDSQQLIQLVETRENYNKTNFSSIAVDAYLLRLTRQANDYELVKKLY
jgi:hypothetical protein